MDTHLKVLSESYPINTNMTGFRSYSEILLLWLKVSLALVGLNYVVRIAISARFEWEMNFPLN